MELSCIDDVAEFLPVAETSAADGADVLDPPAAGADWWHCERLGGQRIPCARVDAERALHGHLDGSWSVEPAPSMHDGAGRSAWNLGQAIVLCEDAPVRRVVRSAAMTGADQMDHYQCLVSFSAAGIAFTAGGRQGRAARGQPLVVDVGQAVELVVGAGTTVQFYVPRELLDELLPAPRDLHGVALVGPSALVLAEHLRSLTACLADMTQTQAPHAATASLHMLVASLAATPDELPTPRFDVPLLRQACRYIELHLSDPELSSRELSSALHVSRATLYRLFEPYGGVLRHIRERRLARIHDILAEAGPRPPLARIAEAHGFENANHFSRAFREQYGYRPSDVATAASAARCMAAVRATPARDPLLSWLRALRG